MEARGDALPSSEKRKSHRGRWAARTDGASELADKENDSGEGEEGDLLDFADTEPITLQADEEAPGGGEGQGEAEDTASVADAGAAEAPQPSVGGRGAVQEPEDSAEVGEEQPSARQLQRQEERLKRRLMRQLIKEDRVSAKTEGELEAAAARRRKQLPAGDHVRLYIASDEKRNEKPKGPLTFPRGGEDAVAELLKVAKAKLSIKSSGKKELWAFVHGGATGEVKHDKHPAVLVSTMELANDDVIFLSSRPKPTPSDEQALEKAPAPVKTRQGPAVSAESAATEPLPPSSSGAGGHLDAVRAAYRRRHARRRWQCQGSPAEIAAQSAELAEQARAWSAADQFDALRRARSSLPAAALRDRFVEAVASAQVVVVSGESGSGKTTQCPHFILEDYISRGRGGECTIVCTQPRRIAAIGVAERVAEERGEEVGKTVGYMVRLDNKSSEVTRLLFCTTGVLLRRLNCDPQLTGITHIVVDEVHERNLQTDFLLTVLKGILPLRPWLKLILMSATFERQRFVDYFARDGSLSRSVPSINIPGRTFPVEVRYQGDVDAAVRGHPLPSRLGSELQVLDPEGSNERAATVDEELEAWIREVHGAQAARPGRTGKLLISPGVHTKPKYDAIADLVAAILRGGLGPDAAEGADEGAVLIFLPGHDEIVRAIDRLRAHAGIGERAWLLPLHGAMPTQLQRRVFQAPPNSTQRKVVVATNIAETSITIDDVTHVIDCGYVKENRYDPRSRMAVLATCFVSQASAQQRAGRAGRVRAGVCWRLFSEHFFDQLPGDTLCEMRRTALEEIVLQTRFLELGDNLGGYLQRAPEPPSAQAVAAALRTLVQIGALGTKAEGLPLTPLGFHLAHMPMDVRTAKMLLYGALMRCLSPMLTIAATLSLNSPFMRPFGREHEEIHMAQKAERQQAWGELGSDQLAVYAAFEGWRVARAAGRPAERSYCDLYGLSSSALESIASLRGRFLRHLQETGFVPESYSADTAVQASKHTPIGMPAAAVGSDGAGDESRDWDPDANSDREALLRCVVCAGLYPNVAQIQREAGNTGGVKTFLVSAGDLDKCKVHPGSLNFGKLDQMHANDGWLLYHTKVKTYQVFLRDSTLTGSIPLLLFGGGDLQAAKDRCHVLLDSGVRDGGLRFDAQREEAVVLLRLLRREVDRLLLVKIADASADISKTAEPLLGAIAQLLQLEGARAAGVSKQAA